jgi:hypothetical protein
MAIKYIYPGSGTVPAIPAQAAFAQRQVATVDLVTTDTAFRFVHNWNFDAAALAKLCPHVISVGAGPAVGQVAVDARAADSIDFNVVVSVAGTFEIVLDRPHSIVMPNQ